MDKKEKEKITTVIKSKTDEDEYMEDLKKQGFSKVDEVRIYENRSELEGLNW